MKVRLVTCLSLLLVFQIADTQLDGTISFSSNLVKNAKASPSYDRNFGEQQMKKMLRDRPKMTVFVQQGDAIWNWTVTQFSGQASGRKVTWVNSFPTNYPVEYRGAHKIVSRTMSTLFCRTEDMNSVPIDGEQMWSVVVFELLNTHHDAKYKQLWTECLSGKLNQQDWVRKCTILDYETLKAQKDFYFQVWEPTLKARAMPLESKFWRLEAPNTYDEWIAQYTDHAQYPWDVYNAAYTNDVIPFIQAHRQQNPKSKNRPPKRSNG